jgi:hypothetical protein
MAPNEGKGSGNGDVSRASNAGKYNYSLAYRLADNSPYIATGLVGALVCYQVHWILAVIELVASALGPLWIIVRVCPTCLLYDNPACSSGYGLVAARLVNKGDPERFGHVFTTQITAVIPMWFLPLAAGIYLWYVGETVPWLYLIVFVVVAFIAVPLKARYVTCAKCPRKSTCPWGSRTAQRRFGNNNSR